MQVSPGTRLGSYEVIAPIGEGGMGEVYRAHDGQLNRTVAIKIVGSGAVRDPDAHSRLTREARAAAALNHPNLCAIYEVAESDGRPFIVMEFVDGSSLDALIPPGGLPAAKAFRYARELANAMAHAHDRGIIHRDLKPANIRFTADGALKVLDFGLAKAAPELPDHTATTAVADLTTPGTVMGTAAYMSPEQAEGKAVDKRTDIWAYGIVLYQMLTGKVPFGGSSFAATVAAVLTADPDLAAAPASARRLLAACLEKDPARRLRDIGDAWALIDADEIETASAVRRWQIAAAGLAIAIVAGAATWIATRPAAPDPPAVTRWTTTLVESGGGERGLAISPDGSTIAYTGRALPVRPIFIRKLSEVEGQAIPGTEGGRRPFFSADGKWLAYFSGVGRSSLMKVALAGGAPVSVCDNAGFLGGHWSEDDQIVVTGQGGLLRVGASGGECESLTKSATANGREGHRTPQLLPGGRTVLFGIGIEGNLDYAQIGLLDVASKQIRTLEQRGTMARYLASGHLVYVRGGAMFAVPFDVERLQVTGQEVLVIDGILWNASGGYSDYSVSHTGTLLYTSATSAHRTLDWLQFADGATRRTIAPPREYGMVRLSPDARLVATAATTGGNGVYIVDLERGTISQISERGSFPVFSPDASRVVYTQRSDGVFVAPTDGSRAPELLAREPFSTPDSITSDGQTLFFSVQAANDPRTRESIKMVALSGGAVGTPWPVTTTGSERSAHISPDGKWMAYVSDESGQTQVYLRSYPGGSGKVAVSVDGGREPRWSRNPQRLFFRNGAGTELMTADLPATPGGPPGRPRAVAPLTTSLWDIAPDGTRALFVANPPQGTADDTGTVHVVMNWFEELRRKTAQPR